MSTPGLNQRSASLAAARLSEKYRDIERPAAPAAVVAIA
jgi:hypothetical protein